ncbi:unnamed protein product [Paramecium primaurelia]|uniref:Uncharacterized protein n=1 Tax=Paramecium primaurelia TaxID=5886 RepID=A0A8S1PGI0_PARPR|nr:unnamed protein product [Paramecium primaurelia]
MSKNNKLIDVAKYLRRFYYRVQNFVEYRMLVNQKHILFVGGNQNPLTPMLYKQFYQNWQIGHLGLQSELPIQPNFLLNQEEELQKLVEQAKKHSNHYDAIIILEDNNQIQQGDDFEIYNIYKSEVNRALIASHLATKILASNGMLCFAVDSKSYFESKLPSPLPTAKVMKDCQIAHLCTNLGERDDLETDSLVVGALIDEDKLNDIVKYIKLWADGIKRPASGTFAHFKYSTHSTPIVYPELL